MGSNSNRETIFSRLLGLHTLRSALTKSELVEVVFDYCADIDQADYEYSYKKITERVVYLSALKNRMPLGMSYKNLFNLVLAEVQKYYEGEIIKP